jgi:hypothetical protein
MNKIFVVVSMFLLMVAGSYGQSLGDVARQQREKQAKDGHAARKVVTNEEIPEHPESAVSASTSTDEHDGAPVASASNDTHSRAERQAKIQAQKS